MSGHPAVSHAVVLDEDGEDVGERIADSAMVFCGVAALQALMAVALGRSALIGAATTAVLAGILMQWRARTAALLLLLLAVIGAAVAAHNLREMTFASVAGAVVAICVLVVAVRAVAATVMWHILTNRQLPELAQESTTVPVAGTLSS